MDEMINSKQAFEDNIRPAVLLLSVYRLLDSKTIETRGEMVERLRSLVGAKADEDLMLIYNHIFMGLVRQSAKLPASDLKEAALSNLLRQAVVAACTALETYLPALLKANLPQVIEARGRDFFPADKALQQFFKNLQFDLPTVARLLGDPDAPLFIANKIVGFIDFQYLSGTKGTHVVGAFLGLEDPWKALAACLHRDAGDMQRIIDETVKRRNDIVHRADRSQQDPLGEQQSITYPWTQQAVDTIEHICYALDTLVAESVERLVTASGDSDLRLVSAGTT